MVEPVCKEKKNYVFFHVSTVSHTERHTYGDGVRPGQPSGWSLRQEPNADCSPLKGEDKRMPKRDMLSIADLEVADISHIVARIVQLATNQGSYARSLQDKTVGIYFRKTSTSTRTSFTLGALLLYSVLWSFLAFGWWQKLLNEFHYVQGQIWKINHLMCVFCKTSFT
ncbi:MAG: hypothetical protein ACRDHZ_25175 [Ktedonobacteraceae bacterium]